MLGWPVQSPGSGCERSELVRMSERSECQNAGSLALQPSGLAHQQSLQSGPTLSCCPGEVQHLFSLLLQLVRNMASSSILMTLEPAFLLAIDVKGQVGGGGVDKGISPLFKSLPSRQKAGLAYPYSHPQRWLRWLTCAPVHQAQLYCAIQERFKACSLECCSWRGAGSSSPVIMTTGPGLLPSTGADEKGEGKRRPDLPCFSPQE